MNTANKLPNGILYWEITRNKHVYIASIIGGYVEDDDNGRLYQENEVNEAIQHRYNTIRKYYPML